MPGWGWGRGGGAGGGAGADMLVRRCTVTEVLLARGASDRTASVASTSVGWVNEGRGGGDRARRTAAEAGSCSSVSHATVCGTCEAGRRLGAASAAELLALTALATGCECGCARCCAITTLSGARG